MRVGNPVELNPGPVKYLCGVCQKAVKNNGKAICCDKCAIWYHMNCTSMSNAVYKTQVNNSKSWICCQCGMPNFDSALFQSTVIDTSNSFELLNSSCESIDSLTSVISPPKYTPSPKKGRNAAQTLKTLVLNAQSLSNKIDEIHCLIDEEKPDIITITETWLNHTIPSSDIITSSYTVYRKDRSEGRGGGVLIAVQNKLLTL